MQWLSESWTWLLLAVAFVAMHLSGHGGHGAHGGKTPRDGAGGCGGPRRDDGMEAASSPHAGRKS